LKHADECTLISYQEVRAFENFISVLVIWSCWFWLSLGETDALNSREIHVLEPGSNLESEIVESDSTIVVTADQVFIMSGQDVNW